MTEQERRNSFNPYNRFPRELQRVSDWEVAMSFRNDVRIYKNVDLKIVCERMTSGNRTQAVYT